MPASPIISIPARRKASLSLNPLANATSPIHILATKFQDYLFFPDPAPLYAVIGAMAANMMTGDPVWLMLIGPPACGKTKLLLSLCHVPKTHIASQIKGPASLLSGTGKKDRARDATGGLLRKIGNTGALILKDFTSVLSMPYESLVETMAALREIYDGRWVRDIGSDGGRSIEWEGKIALLGGVTPVIDRHHSVVAEMGERMIFFRYPESDGFGECKTSLAQEDPQQAQALIQQYVEGFFSALDLDWDQPYARRDFEPSEWLRFIAMASLTAKCRSTVTRNRYTREVEEIDMAEFPTRVCGALAQLYLGMELIGLEADERWRIIGKIAMDCMPQLRRRTLERIRDGETGGVESTTEDLQGYLRVSSSSTKRVLEDLEIHGVLEKRVGVTGKKWWVISGWAKAEMERGWGTACPDQMKMF